MNKQLLILNDARNSLSDYCINKCGALCCKKGYLLLQSDNEINALFDNTDIELDKILQITENNKIRFNLEKTNCPRLKDNMCSIYKNPNRPIICSDFPIFKVNEFIITSPFCPAIRENLLDEYLKQLEKEGFKII